jgi:tyrosyl-tRNA synthetase
MRMPSIDKVLTRGVANIIPNRVELEKLLESGKKLNVYLGIDPTAPRIHLGHAVPLIKLQKFAELGHNVTLLIGDFTALIGDTSDKDTERPVLTKEQIEENFKTYKSQAEKILDFSRIQVKHNSEWLSKLGFEDVVRLTQKFSVGDFISRELIKKRLNEGGRIGLHEVLYPVMQGYDSYHLDTDIQIGGTDQTFNMQAGRTLQKLIRDKESYVLATEFLMGTDGRKMSKSWGNAIWLDDNPSEMYRKIMSINDDLIVTYFTLVTQTSNEEIEEIKKLVEENPLDAKKKLAFEIVKYLNTEEEAKKAANEFEKTVQKKEVPAEIKEFDGTGKNLESILLESNLVGSRSDLKRLIKQSGIEVNGQKLELVNLEIEPENGMVVKVGKHKFLKIKASS